MRLTLKKMIASILCISMILSMMTGCKKESTSYSHTDFAMGTVTNITLYGTSDNLEQTEQKIIDMEKKLEKQQLYTDIEQTLLSLHTGYSEHQQALSQLDAETLVLKESERKWEEGLISVFQLMEARNRFIAAKAELVRVRLQIEMMMKLEKYYRQGTFL